MQFVLKQYKDVLQLIANYKICNTSNQSYNIQQYNFISFPKRLLFFEAINNNHIFVKCFIFMGTSIKQMIQSLVLHENHA